MDEIIEALEEELKKVVIPLNLRKNVNNNKVRSITFGKVKHRGHGTPLQDSRFNAKWPKIWDLIQTLGNIIAKNICWSSVQLNHNVKCDRHIDKNNISLSVIISFGQYVGGEFYVQELGDGLDCYVRKKTYHQPITFDGSIMHYNDPLLSGNKYSLVYFNYI